MKHAAIYARVSTAGQEDEQTINNQIYEIQARIKDDGNLATPETTYLDDGWTGTILERPALDRMRSDAKEKKFEVLYFYDRGRISRRFVYQEVILDELRKVGIECISLHDSNGTSPEETILGGFTGLFHEYERLKITERMRQGKMRKVKIEKKLLGYNPSYGYDYRHRIKGGVDARDGFFEINQKEAEVVRQIFQWVADGVSLRDVIRRLYAAGIPPKKQKRMTWTKGPIARMLQNETYIGTHYYNKSEAIESTNPKYPAKKYRRISKTSRRIRPKEEWLMVEVPRIISDELFNKVQSQLKLNQKFSRRNNKKNDYLLTGIIDCDCGKPRTGDPGANGNLYYRCTDRLSRFPMPRECYAGGVNATVVDSLVWSKLKELLASPEQLRKQAERWVDSASSSPAVNKAKEVRMKLKALDDEERRYVKAYGTGFMSERLYKEQMQGIASRRTSLQKELSESESKISKQPKLSTEQLVAGVQKMLGNLDFTDKKAIIRQLVTNIKSTQESISIWGHLPVLVKAEVGFESEYRDCRVAECW
jgi:site-specific DNA recombinase